MSDIYNITNEEIEKALNNTYKDIIYRLRATGDVLHTHTQMAIMCILVKYALNIEGDMVEVGVFKGGTAELISLLKGNKTLHLFDTWEGFPINAGIKGIDSRWDDNDTVGRYKAEIDFVKGKLKQYSNIFFYKGTFPDTSEPIKDKKFSFVHLDVDLYRYTLESLIFFYPRMSIGGIILIHDCNFDGVKKAIEEFFNDKPEKVITFIKENIKGDQAYIIKR